MTERLVSPDLRLWFIADNEDLKPIKALYGLSKSQKGNIKQLLGWKNVGNGRGDRNGRDERKKAKNWVLFHSVSWLKHDDGTEYVPLVCNLDHKFSVVAGRPDKYIGSMGSLRNLLNGLKAHIGRWRKGGRERCTSQPHKTPSQIALLALCCKNSSAARGRLQRLAARTISFMGGGAPKKAAGKNEKYKNTQLAAAVLEIKEP